MRKILLNTTVLAIIACFLWSTAFAGIKLGLPYTEPLNFAGIRFFLSGLMILPLCGGLKKYIQQIRDNWQFVLKVSFFQTFMLYALFYQGVNLVPGALAAIIVGASPVMASLLAHFFLNDDKLSLSKILSISLGMAGVIIIALSRGKFSFSEGKEFWGIILLIIANISGNYGNIIVSRDKSKYNIHPLILNSAQIMLGGLFLFLLSLPIEGFELKVYPVPYYVALLWLSFLSAAAFSIWFILLQRTGVKVSYLNIWKFIIPVFGAALSWSIVPGESPEIIAIVGMVIISLSLVLTNVLNLKNGRKQKVERLKSLIVK